MPYIKHSAKGSTWGKHKYIAIRNGRYIYPDDKSNDERISSDRNYYQKITRSGQQSINYGTRMPTYNTQGKILDDKRKKERERQKLIEYDVSRKAGTKAVRDYKREAFNKRVNERVKELRKNGQAGSSDTKFMMPVSKNKKSLYRKEVRAQKKLSRDFSRQIEKWGATIAKSKGKEYYKNYKKEKRKDKNDKAKAAVSSAIKKVSTATKSSVSKGRSAVSSFLSRFKKKG